MLRLRPDLSRFTRCLWLTFAAFVAFAVVFIMYVRAEKQIDLANDLRFQSYLLADELRQSSDDLTRLVRSYVVTGDPIYKQHFQEVLDIRDGKKPRPVDYHQIYWDLVQGDDQRPRQNSGQSVSLLELMRQSGFTEAEFAKLAEAKTNSDALTNTEFAAMALVETPSLAGEAPPRLKASLMLNDKSYYAAKVNIMRPIGEFYQLMEQRTLKAVHTRANIAAWLRALFVGSTLLLMTALWRAYRTLHTTLGAPVDEVYAHIQRIGSGDFAGEFPVIALGNNIMAWLQETQQNLARLDAKHKQSEANNLRLTKLYAALSQCNQAIVRCKNQDELFAQICHGAVHFGGMRMAWIGLLDRQNGYIQPVASYGSGTEYLDDISITFDASQATGQGPAGTSMHEDRPYWCQDFQSDPATANWRERAMRYGWRSSASIPLHDNGEVIGAFTLYSSEVYAFDEAARNLLIEMAVDIDYALHSLAQEAQRKQVASALVQSHKLLKSIIDTAPMRVFWKDRNSIYVGCNPAFAHDAGLASPDDVIGKSDFDFCWREQAEAYRHDDRLVMDTNTAKLFFEEQQAIANEDVIWLRASKVPLHDENDQIIGVLGIYEDISEQKHAEQHIHFLANFDPLTGLPNRAQLNERLKYSLSLAKRSNGHLALMFLDLDRFKDINDTLGHSIGDAVLVELAHRLRSMLREEDTVTRMGGDEFIFLLPGTDARGAAYVAQKLLDIIVEPYRIHPYELILSASIGIAIYPGDGTNLETLSQSADSAMYRAKQEGRQGYRFFTPEMHARSTRNLQLLNALHHALELRQLHIHYQPQVNVKSGRIVGAEALLRWQHPVLGMVSPAEFIPVAEDSGLILPIGEWVMRTATAQAVEWMQQGFSPISIAVNLSAIQFRQPDLVDMIVRVLDETKLPAELLELELTESVAMQNPQNAVSVMDKLNEIGVNMSIDDFGTGYSSLNYLKKFKVRRLKIDQSFVRDISTDPEDRAIVKAIISLAHSLGMQTVAEGVESVEQQTFLREQSCDQLQGYLFGKPVPNQQFEAMLAKNLLLPCADD